MARLAARARKYKSLLARTSVPTAESRPSMLRSRTAGNTRAVVNEKERLVITNDSPARPTGNTLTSPRGRGARIALWIVQIALAVMFLFAGGSKLMGAPAMVALFGAIGVGQWFRYVTGAIEFGAAVALLIPSAAVFGATLLIPTMIGAIATNVFLGQSVAPPLVLLVVASTVLWARRKELRAIA